MSEQPAPFAFQEAPEWQNAMTLAEQVYAKTERFPLREHVGLAASMRASAQLVASSIASANMQAAHTAAKALFTQATLAARLGHLSTDDALVMLGDIEAVSTSLHKEKPALKLSESTPREETPRQHEHARSSSKRPDKRSRESGRPYGDKRAKRGSN